MEYITTFSSFCSLYTLSKNYLPKPYSDKARVIVSTTNSLFLSLLSYYTFYNWTLHPVTYFINQPEQVWLANYTISYFSADLFLGHMFDRKNLNFLTGYVHHTAFIAMVYHVKVTQQSNIIYLLVPFEIPTFFLDLTRIHNDPMLNKAFGLSFFTFRLLYNLYVIGAMWTYSKPYAFITSLLLIIHTHWFRQWIIKMQKQSI
jgi:hypothetical protein